MKVRVNGVLKSAPGAKIKVGANWKRLIRIKMKIGGVWKEIASFIPPLSASASPATVAKAVNGGGTGVAGPVTATPTGGRAPYTYAWTRLTGTASITAPGSSGTYFSDTVGPNETRISTFKCTVTSSDGQTADTNTVTASIAGVDFSTS